MRILIIKTSSMGDVIHTLPAITDLRSYYPHAIIDWVVEEDFAEIPKVHEGVTKVITVALRRWRKNFFNKNSLLEIKNFFNNLRAEQYDYIVDAQGLLKSGIITKLARLNQKGKRHGLDYKSARGKYISWLYHDSYNIDTQLHAIYRLKLLFSKIFKFTYDKDLLNYGLDYNKINLEDHNVIKEKDVFKPYLVFLHCTTWQSKKWPITYWRNLIQLAIDNGFRVKLNSGNIAELADAEQLATGFHSQHVIVMPPQSIKQLLVIIAQSDGIVCVDTGLGHLAAALNKPGVGIFGATSPKLTSILSKRFINIAASYPCSPCFLRSCDKLLVSQNTTPPCYDDLTPNKVWQALLVNITNKASC
jgi:heptosyltransferase-1